MGINLSDLAVKTPISLQSLSGKVVAVDAFNTIYQFLASIRQEDGNPLMDFKGRITSHLSGIYFRNARLIENGIRSVYVFDGKPPYFKKGTQNERARTKLDAEKKWREALEAGKMEEAKKFAQATSRLTGEMVEEAKHLLLAMGIPCIQAPSEGEAQAAQMARDGQVYASASQDYDSMLFGSPLLVRNINITGKRKVAGQDKFIVVEPEEIQLEGTLSSLGITRENLIMLGLLVGTDFNEGVPKVGPKTALKIVKGMGIEGVKSLKEYVKTKYNYDFEEYIEEVYHFFLSPPVMAREKTNFQFAKPDRGRVLDILVKQHDFSQERIEKVFESMEKAVVEKGAQSRLEKWF